MDQGPFHWISRHKNCLQGYHFQILDILKANSDYNVNQLSPSPSQTLFTPLHCACESGDMEIVRWLVEQGAASINVDGAKSGKGKLISPLAVAVQNEQVNVVEYLVRNPACDVNQRNSTGATALHVACESGFFEGVEALLTYSAQPVALEQENIDGCTPLNLACFKRHTKIALFLLLNGSNAAASNIDGYSPLHLAAR